MSDKSAKMGHEKIKVDTRPYEPSPEAPIIISLNKGDHAWVTGARVTHGYQVTRMEGIPLVDAGTFIHPTSAVGRAGLWHGPTGGLEFTLALAAAALVLNNGRARVEAELEALGWETELAVFRQFNEDGDDKAEKFEIVEVGA